MYREHFGLRQALLGKDSTELWDDGAHALLRERFQWLLQSPGLDRRGEDMSIIGVRERQAGDQVFVAGNESIWYCAVHEIGRAVQLLQRQIRPV